MKTHSLGQDCAKSTCLSNSVSRQISANVGGSPRQMLTKCPPYTHLHLYASSDTATRAASTNVALPASVYAAKLAGIRDKLSLAALMRARDEAELSATSNVGNGYHFPIARLLPSKRKDKTMDSGDTLAIVMVGGVRSRLAPLTRERAKPAVPFGGQYRIIDFTFSNCQHSRLRQVFVLTQYKSDSMHRHLRGGRSICSSESGEFITAVPPQLKNGDSWYCGTADTLYQKLELIRRSGAKHVIVLSVDHVYRMNYSDILRQHQESDAELTVGCMKVSLGDARSFGVMSIADDNRIYAFNEKPANCRTSAKHLLEVRPLELRMIGFIWIPPSYWITARFIRGAVHRWDRGVRLCVQGSSQRSHLLSQKKQMQWPRCPG